MDCQFFILEIEVRPSLVFIRNRSCQSSYFYLHPRTPMVLLYGNWNEGFALNYHTISSVYLGLDMLGREQFDTKRTLLGEFLYELKYNKDLSKLDDIMKIVESFLPSWRVISDIDVVLPAPPSNENRIFQPVFIIAKRVGEYLKRDVFIDVLVKKDTEQSKNLSLYDKNKVLNSIMMKRNAKRPYNILIIDDLYQTGVTLNAAVKALRTDSNIKNIYVLTLTKTRR